MSFIQSLQIISPLNSNIECVENKSDLFMKRALVHFKNGYKLSVIQGGYSYGGIQGLFEIAIFDKDGNWKPELFDGLITAMMFWVINPSKMLNIILKRLEIYHEPQIPQISNQATQSLHPPNG